MDKQNIDPKDALLQCKILKRKALDGVISWLQTEYEIQPYLDIVNAKFAEIAKKHKRRAIKMTFGSVSVF